MELKTLFKTHFPALPIPKIKSISSMKNLLYKNGVIDSIKPGYNILKQKPRYLPLWSQDINIEIVSHILETRHYTNGKKQIPGIFFTCKAFYNLWSNGDLWDLCLTRKFQTQILYRGASRRARANFSSGAWLRTIYSIFSMFDPRDQWKDCVEISIMNGLDDIYFLLMQSNYESSSYSMGFLRSRCLMCGSKQCWDIDGCKTKFEIVTNQFQEEADEKNIEYPSQKELEWEVSIILNIMQSSTLSKLQKYKYTATACIVFGSKSYRIQMFFLALLIYFLAHHSAGIDYDILIEILFHCLPSYSKNHKQFGWEPLFIMPKINSVRLFKYAEEYFDIKAQSQDTIDIYRTCMVRSCLYKQENRGLIRYMAATGKLRDLDEEEWYQALTFSGSIKIANLLLKSYTYSNDRLQDIIAEDNATKWCIAAIFRFLHREKYFLSDEYAMRNLFVDHVNTLEELDILIDLIDDAKPLSFFKDCLTKDLIHKPIDVLEKSFAKGLYFPTISNVDRFKDDEYVIILLRCGSYVHPRNLLQIACEMDSVELAEMAFSMKGYKIYLTPYIKLCIKKSSVFVLEKLLIRFVTGAPKIKDISKIIPPVRITDDRFHFQKIAVLIDILVRVRLISSKDLYHIVLRYNNPILTDILIKESIIDPSLPYLQDF